MGAANGLRVCEKDETMAGLCERPIKAISHGWDGSMAGIAMLIKEHMGPLRLQFRGSSRAVWIVSCLTHVYARYLRQLTRTLNVMFVHRDLLHFL